MRRVIAAINMTLDGYCDHTAIVPDEEIHWHYSELLRSGGTILYGRITYQLMGYWQQLLIKPSGEADMDDFAVAIDQIEKIVFSRTLKSTGWESAMLANRGLEEVVSALRKQTGKDIFVGSRSLIMQLLKLNLIDELQLCVHPVIAGKGLPLFESINDRIILKHRKSKIFSSGAVVLYYEPLKPDSSGQLTASS